MSRSIEEALAKSLEMVETGEATPEEVLSLYPELKAELEPLLALSAELRALPKVEAPARLRGYKRPVFRPAPVKEPGWRRLLPRFGPSLGWATPLAQVAAVLALLIAAAEGTIVASASSLPDDPLYPVKLAVEDAQLSLAPNDSARAALELRFASRRLDEVATAADQGRTEAVAKGAELYQQRAAAAVKAAESSTTDTDTTQIEDTLRQNQAALTTVLGKLEDRDAGKSADHSNAVEAIKHAMTASEGAAGSGENPAPKEKKTPEPLAPAIVPSPTAAATAVPTATATAVPEPTPGHEPPGKAKPKTEQSAAPPQEQRGEGSAQRANPGDQASDQASPTPTSVPDAQANGRGQGADTGKANGSQKGTDATATTTATTMDPGDHTKKGNDNRPNLFDNIVDGIRGFVTRR